MKRKLILSLTAIALVAAVTIGGTLAYFTDKTDSTNTVAFGNVDITLNVNYQSTTGSDNIGWKNGSNGIDMHNIVPGDTINANASLTNTGVNAAYIRIKFEFSGTYNGQEYTNDTIPADIRAQLNSIMLTNLTSNLPFTSNRAWWIQSDGYFYYTNILSANTSLTLFGKMDIPISLGNDFENANGAIKVIAEAVQAAHVTPNYSSDNPWGNIGIE